MNELELLLLAPNRITPEDLRAAGYSAARAHLTKQANLSEEVARYAREKNLNDNQIERVIETANQAVFGSMFKTAESKQIEFPVADPRIVRELLRRDDVTKTASYLPIEMEMAHARNKGDTRDIEQFFGITKVAELDTDLIRREMGRDVLSLMDLKNELKADLAGARENAKVAAMEMQTKVRQYIDLTGETPEGICEAITGMARNHAVAKTAMRAIFGAEAADGITKTAQVGRIINEQHPVVQSYAQFEDAVVDLYAREQLLQDVTEQQSSVRNLAQNTDRLLGLADEGRELQKEAGIAGYMGSVYGKSSKKLVKALADSGKPTSAATEKARRALAAASAGVKKEAQSEAYGNEERPSLGERLAQRDGGGPTHSVSRALTSPLGGAALGVGGLYGAGKASSHLLDYLSKNPKAIQFLMSGAGKASVVGGAGLAGAAAAAGGRSLYAKAMEGRANMGGDHLSERERAMLGVDKEAGFVGKLVEPLMKRMEVAAKAGAAEEVGKRIDQMTSKAVTVAKYTGVGLAAGAGGYAIARAMSRKPIHTPDGQPKLASAAARVKDMADELRRLRMMNKAVTVAKYTGVGLAAGAVGGAVARAMSRKPIHTPDNQPKLAGWADDFARAAEDAVRKAGKHQNRTLVDETRRGVPTSERITRMDIPQMSDDSTPIRRIPRTEWPPTGRGVKKQAAAPARSFMQRAGKFFGLMKEGPAVLDSAYLTPKALQSLGDDAANAFALRNSRQGANALGGQDLADELSRIRAEMPDPKKMDDRMNMLARLDPAGMRPSDALEATGFGKGVSRALGTAAVGVPAIMGLNALISGGERLDTKAKKGPAWQKFITAHPDLAAVPSARAQFNTLWSVAPSVANDPAMAGPWLKRVDSMGGRDVGLDLKAVRDAADLEKAIGDARSSTGSTGGSLRMTVPRALASSWGAA